MTLAPGARLGPYQIVAPVGAGGMGEVFRARDTRLGREVAVKVLPGGAAADPERRARFEQEARSACALTDGQSVVYGASWEGGGLARSGDGRTVVARDHDGRLGLYPTEGGEPSALAGALLDDVPIRWTGDGKGLFVQRGSGVPARVDVIDVVSGARRPWKELRPPDPAGVLAIGPVLLSADGQSYVYSYRRQLDDLYLVEGLR
jgi:hypothetical protein